MASSIDISNLALSHLGDSANISDFDEGSAQADHCSRFYPIALNKMLEMHAWNFATRRATLAELTDPPASAWAYAYGLPSNMARALAVLAPLDDDRKGVRYSIESADDGTPILFTNQGEAVLRYVAKITDTAFFSPLFVDALTWLLASYLAGPIIKGTDGINAGRAAYKAFEGALALAAAADANQQKVDLYEMPTSLAARGGSLASPYLADGRITR